MTIDANTLLLMSCDGGDGSTVFTDTGVNALGLTAVGDAKQKTDQFKFSAGSSLFVDGSVDLVQADDHSQWDFLTSNFNPFTIDMWVRFASISTHKGFISQDGGLNHAWGLYWFTSGNLSFEGRKSFQNQKWTATWLPVINTWYHLAVARDASDNRFLFVDGVPLTLTADIKATAWSSGASGIVEVGYDNTGSHNFFMNGWMDEIRFSDVDRYGSGTPFTPETTPYGTVPPPPPAETFNPAKFWIPPRNPIIKPIRMNPGFSITPAMHIPVPIKMDKWDHIKNVPARVKKRNIANVTQHILVQFNTPASEVVLVDKWFQQQPVPRIKKRGNPNAHVDIDFIESIQEQNGNYFDTGVFAFTLTENGDDQADYADSDAFDFTITANSIEDFQLADVEAINFTIGYPITGNEIFNSGVPGFVSANVIIDGVNESEQVRGVIVVTREDNTAARFKVNLELDQTLVPPRKPSELINKIVSISFAAADMSGIVADYVPIFTGICKHVSFNDNQQTISMTGYDYGGVHQTRGEFVSNNVTDVSSGALHVSSAGTHALGHSPVWGIIWTGNAAVTDGEDYFINTLNGSIIVPISSRILQFPGAFTYNYQNPFGSMREIIQSVATLKGWTLEEDNVTIEDYSGPAEHPVLSLSNESVIDVCRKFLEISGAKVESNLFPALRVYSEVQNVINTVNFHTVDEDLIFDDSLTFRADFDNMLNEQTTRSVQKINANVVIGSGVSIGEFSANKPSVNPFTVQTSVGFAWNLDLGLETVLAEHRVKKAGLNSISFTSSGRFHLFHTFESFEEQITGASWISFIDGDDFVVQLKHKVEVIGGGGVLLWAYPAVEYELTIFGSSINYGDGAIEDVKVVTAQRPITGITETLAGDVYENPYIETDQHCANICDAILLEHGNPYMTQFEIPVFVGKSLNIGDRLNIERDSSIRFTGIIKTLSYSINLATGENAIQVAAKGVGVGI